MIPGGIAEQTERVFANLQAVLTAAGVSASSVVKTTVFLKDLRDFAAMNEIYVRFFAAEGVVAPARSTVQVAALPKDALVEIECIALV
jgi:2-iminobutanoate/2-iminopropanoate deaminase